MCLVPHCRVRSKARRVGRRRGVVLNQTPDESVYNYVKLLTVKGMRSWYFMVKMSEVMYEYKRYGKGKVYCN